MSNLSKLATHAKKFKPQAVQLAEKHSSLLKTAKELGISNYPYVMGQEVLCLEVKEAHETKKYGN